MNNAMKQNTYQVRLRSLQLIHFNLAPPHKIISVNLLTRP